MDSTSLHHYGDQYLSSDLEPSFFEEYRQAQERLERIFGYPFEKKEGIPDRTVIMSGEAMVALWGGLKSLILPGETRVLAIANGIYGEGIGGMAKGIGAEVQFVKTPFDKAISLSAVSKAAQSFHPDLITFVHCDTPCGNLNTCLVDVGKIAREVRGLSMIACQNRSSSPPQKLYIYNTELHVSIFYIGRGAAVC